MTKTVILGNDIPGLDELIEERRRRELDGYDEVWKGDYHMVPMARPWHGIVQAEVMTALNGPATERGLRVIGPFNLGVDSTDYRVPDAGVIERVTDELYVPSARIVIEIVSPDDETFDKFEFYWEREVEEILTVDRNQIIRWWVRAATRFWAADESAILGLSVTELRDRIRWPKGASDE